MKSSEDKVIDGLSVSVGPLSAKLDDDSWIDVGYAFKKVELEYDEIVKQMQEAQIAAEKAASQAAKMQAKAAELSSKYASTADKLEEWYGKPYNSPEPPLITVWLQAEPTIGATAIKVEVKYKGMIKGVKQVINDEMLHKANKHEFKYIKENIAGKIAQELAFKCPLDMAEEKQVYADILKTLNNGSPASAYANTYSGDNFSTLAYELPAVRSMVKHPPMGDPLSYVGKLLKCKGHEEADLMSMVIHLNDQHKWTREKIADWIDELHDSGIIDAEFHIEMEDENERSS